MSDSNDVGCNHGLDGARGSTPPFGVTGSICYASGGVYRRKATPVPELGRELAFLGEKKELIRTGAFEDVQMAMMCHASSGMGDQRFSVEGHQQRPSGEVCRGFVASCSLW